MKINIKDFFKQEKAFLSNTAGALDLTDKIKLGIIDATADGDVANAIYINKKVEDFKDRGWNVEVYKTKDVPTTIKEASKTCSAIIVQEPIAKDAIPYSALDIEGVKDVDGLSPLSEFWPATPKGIIMYLNKCGFNYEGKNAVVLGRSDIVGKPMAKMLLDRNMNVTVLHSKTSDEDKAYYLAHADLVIAAVGKAGILKREDCPHAIVVDVGINRNEEGKLCGDFVENEDYVNDEVWSTPVPGGVGLLTRLALMVNTLESAMFQFTDIDPDVD